MSRINIRIGITPSIGKLSELFEKGLAEAADWMPLWPLVVERLIEGIKRYAAFEKADPFALDRCLCHLRQGLCARTFGQHGESHDGHYDAEELSTFKDGIVHRAYKHVVRP